MSVEDEWGGIGEEIQESAFHSGTQEKLEKTFVVEYTFKDNLGKTKNASMNIKSKEIPNEKQATKLIKLPPGVSKENITILSIKEKPILEEELYDFDDPLD